MEAKKQIMEAETAAPRNPSYNEFEPFCQWQREAGRDVLVLHLPEFKKDELRVQINNRGTLKVSGEHSSNAWRKSKFYKEVQVPKNCNTNEIQAKFANGCLYVIMPKKTKAPPEQTKPQEGDGSGVDHKTKPESTQDRVDQKPAPAEKKETAGSSKEKMLPSPNVAGADQNKSAKDVTKPKLSVSRMKSCAKISLNVALMLAVLAALIAYTVYMYRSTLVLD